MSESSTTASQCYYSVLGLCKQASLAEIRSAYRKLALKWHPDRWTRNDPVLAGDAKRRFQQIQEAYSVLSDNDKRLMYDAGLLDVFEDDDGDENDIDEKGFSDFMQEMVTMMESSRHQKRHSLDELQVMLGEIMAGDDSFNFNDFKKHSLDELQLMLGEIMAGDDSFNFNDFSNPQVSRNRTRFATS